MKKIKVSFPGGQGNRLEGLLELPDESAVTYALFAHCFTCGKDVVAASRIARALVGRGIGVLRFDFTGLGGSDGDFANTNFSSNVGDLVAAADFLRTEYQAPSLMIGHSLGGTAVLNAAHRVAECRGVATIGSPAEASHVARQFSCDLDTIRARGEAEVSLAGRAFTIKEQFLDDIESQSESAIANLRKSLLIFHSPIDNVVSIKQAEKIYQSARHPKSFVSLDRADHLLTKRQDAQYVADTIATWAGRFIEAITLPALSDPGGQARPVKGEVVVKERNHVFAQDVASDHHDWIADEPLALGGTNLGPDPYEHLLAALGTCTSMTIRMYAERKRWPVDDVKVTLSHKREHGEDCRACDEAHPQIDVIHRRIHISGDLSEAQLGRLFEIADRCPVHKTLHGKLVVETIKE